MVIYLFILWSFLRRPPMTTLIKIAPYPIFFFFLSYYFLYYHHYKCIFATISH